MSGYSEMARDADRQAFLDKWAPTITAKLTLENLRWNMARANAAESELHHLKTAIKLVIEASR